MFEILYDQSVVGEAEMVKEGLYYKIKCTCMLPESGIHRIVVNDGETLRDLGVCVPVGDKFVVNVRIPTKYIKGKNLKFYLVSDKNKGIVVATGMPFSQLDNLESARLQIANGQTEIIIDSVPDPQDSDPNPEHPQISESE